MQQVNQTNVHPLTRDETGDVNAPLCWFSVLPGGSVVLAPVALAAVGFTSAGIAAGSVAASMMSTAAIANGGGVAAGSVVALLQSAGR